MSRNEAGVLMWTSGGEWQETKHWMFEIFRDSVPACILANSVMSAGAKYTKYSNVGWVDNRIMEVCSWWEYWDALKQCSPDQHPRVIYDSMNRNLLLRLLSSAWQPATIRDIAAVHPATTTTACGMYLQSARVDGWMVVNHWFLELIVIIFQRFRKVD